MKVYKMAIIGFGNQGEWHYENIKNRLSRIKVEGVFDIDDAKASLAKSFGLKVYENIDKLWQDKDIDIVLVATPNNFHKQYCIDALKSGKNVVCEKPVCMNSQELEQILQVVNSTKKTFTVHHNRRWDADYVVVKNIIDSGIIGKPYSIQSRLFGCKGLPGDWRSSRVSGGGMLYDWSVHLVDQILNLINSKPDSVFIDMQKIRFKEVDDCNNILIKFQNGAHANIVVNSWCYISENRWHISGDDGTAVIPTWGLVEGKIIKANIKDMGWEKGFVYTDNGRSSTMAPRPIECIEELSVPAPIIPKWEDFYNNFLDVIEGRAKLIVTHSQIKTTTKVIDACFRSAQSAQEEKIF